MIPADRASRELIGLAGLPEAGSRACMSGSAYHSRPDTDGLVTFCVGNET
jgi:hypothetical protein